MPCAFCVHFRNAVWPKRSMGEYRLGEVQGQCGVEPVWRPVNGGHFCGRLLFENPELPASWWHAINEIRRDRNEERKLRIEAQKAAKVLRAKLRLLRAKS
jgi:hypothetical protein